MSKTPCYNCNSRELSCHSKCTNYQMYKEKLSKKSPSERNFSGYLADAIQRMKGVKI